MAYNLFTARIEKNSKLHQQTYITNSNRMSDGNLFPNWSSNLQSANWFVFSTYFCRTRFFLPNHIRETKDLPGCSSQSVSSSRCLLPIFSLSFLLLFIFRLRDFFSNHLTQTHNFSLLSHLQLRDYYSPHHISRFFSLSLIFQVQRFFTSSLPYLSFFSFVFH